MIANILQIICKCEIFAFTLQYRNRICMTTTDKIKQAGLKVTPQRIVVYEVMTKLGHAQMEEILSAVQAKVCNMTPSTVYRILDSFCKANLLAMMCHPETGKCYYDITTHEHHHLYVGNKIVDFDDSELSALIRRYLKEKYVVESDEEIAKIQVQIITHKKTTK